MQELTFLWIMPLLLIVGMIFRPLLTTLHELGHAIPALCFTKGDVKIFVGSDGDMTKGIGLRIGRLSVQFRFVIFSYRGGFCFHDPVSSKWKQFLIVFARPTTETLITTSLCIFVFSLDLHAVWKVYFLILFLWSFAFLIVTLVPANWPFKLKDGRFSFNDGYQLLDLSTRNWQAKKYQRASEEFNLGNFHACIQICEEVFSWGLRGVEFYRLAAYAHIQTMEFQKVVLYARRFLEYGVPDETDWFYVGLANSELGFHVKAKQCYEKTLALDAKHQNALANLAYTNMVLKDYPIALDLFDRLIVMYPSFGYAFSNRGLCKIWMGREESGLADLTYAYSLSEMDPFYFRNMGIYYLENGNRTEALACFEKAFQLYPSTHLLEELKAQAEALPILESPDL